VEVAVIGAVPVATVTVSVLTEIFPEIVDRVPAAMRFPPR
jgi:hypothetical protein